MLHTSHRSPIPTWRPRSFRADRFPICRTHSRSCCRVEAVEFAWFTAAHISWAGCVIYRSSTTYHNDSLWCRWSRSWSICPRCATVPFFGCTFFWPKYFCVTGWAQPLYRPLHQPLHCKGATTRVSHPVCVTFFFDPHLYLSIGHGIASRVRS